MEDILRALIAFRTVSGNRSETDRAFEFIARHFASLGWQEKIFESNGFENRYYSLTGSMEPTILLTAHLDVVAAAESLFELKYEQGKYFGRGVLDMKFAVAQFMQLARELPDSNQVGILFTCDEEIGGHNGTRFVLEATGLRPKIVFLPDGGYNWQIEEKAKGVIWLEIQAQGLASHSSRPWEGESAIELLIDFLARLRSIFPEISQADQYYHTTWNIGSLQGGQALNQVSASATAKLDIRYIPEDDPNQILAKLQVVADQYQGKIRLQEIMRGSHSHSKIDHPYILTFIKIAQTYGIQVGKTFSHGSSDARFYFEKDIPVLMVAPKGSGHHTDQEWVSEPSLQAFYQVLKAWVGEITKL